MENSGVFRLDLLLFVVYAFLALESRKLRFKRNVISGSHTYFEADTPASYIIIILFLMRLSTSPTSRALLPPPLFDRDLKTLSRVHPIDLQLARVFEQVRIESSVARAFSSDELFALHDLIDRHHSLVEWTVIYDFIGMRLYDAVVFPGRLPAISYDMTHSVFTSYAEDLWHDEAILRRIVLEFFPYLCKVVRRQVS